MSVSKQKPSKRRLLGFVFAAIIASVMLLPIAHTKATEPQLQTLTPQNWNGETVVLLHGLIRSSRSMKQMANSLYEAGYATCNIGYPSRRFTVEQLASEHVLPLIERCVSADNQALHFVTHSMGGIILRQLRQTEKDQQGPMRKLGRAVMLAPPNQGSELVDKLGSLKPFYWINGPAGLQLGTGSDGLPRKLGPIDFELGVITGDKSLSPAMSRMIPGPDDGKVSVASAQIEGMQDFLLLPVSHTFIMTNKDVINETQHFLKHGRFTQSSH